MDYLTRIDGWRLSPRDGQSLVDNVDLMANDWEVKNDAA